MIIYIHNSLPFESGKSCILSLLRDILASNLYTYSIALLNGKCLESLRVRTKASLNRNNPYTADTWNTLKITNILINMCVFFYTDQLCWRPFLLIKSHTCPSLVPSSFEQCALGKHESLTGLKVILE